MEWEKEPFKQKYTPRTEPRQEKPKAVHAMHTAHGKSEAKFDQGAPPLSAVRVMSVIMVGMILVLIFFYFKNASLDTKIEDIEKEKTKLQDELNKTITAYEEKVKVLEGEKSVLQSEKTSITEELNQEKKVRDVAERKATLQALTSEDLGIKVQTTASDNSILQQQLDLEKQRSADLSNIIAQMTNTSTTMQATIKELNDKLNACVLSSS